MGKMLGTSKDYNQENAIDFIVSILLSGEKEYRDLEGGFTAKFGDLSNLDLILERCESYGIVNKRMKEHRHYSFYALTNSGLRVANAGFKSFIEDRNLLDSLEISIKKQQLKNLKNTNRLFWYSSTLGIIGGILGIFSFFLNIKDTDKMESIEDKGANVEVKSDTTSEVKKDSISVLNN